MKLLKNSCILTILIILSIPTWFSIWFIITGSFMGADEIISYVGPAYTGHGYVRWSIFANYPTLKPYIELLIDTPNYFTAFWNSCKISFAIIIGQLFVAVPAAWYFAKYDSIVNKLLYVIYIGLMLLPFQVTMISNYLVIDKLELVNTHSSIILPAVFSTFPVFIMVKYFISIDRSLLEAAALDNANDFQIFLYIGIPLGSGGIITVFVLMFIEYWNIVEQPLIFIKSKSLWPLSLYLPKISVAQLGIAMVASIVSLFPTVLIFIFGQEFIEQGIIASGLKE